MLHNTGMFPADHGSRCKSLSAHIGALAILAITTLAITTPACAEAPPLATAVIEGSTPYSAADLFDSYRDQLGQPITRDSARAIVTALQERYARDGFSRPEITLDDDLVARGILRVEVFEAHITRVVLSGDPGPHAEALHSITAPLPEARPLRRADLQQTLRRLRELPGLAVTANTRRDEAARNGFELAVDTSFRPVDGLVRLTNRGTEEIGPVFALSQFALNGLLGVEEKIGLLTTTAGDFDEYHGAGAFLDAPLGLAETDAMLMGFRSWSNPTELGADLNEHYVRDRLSLRLTRRLDTSSELQWSAMGALELEDLEIESGGTQYRDDQLRILTLGTRLGWRSGERSQNGATLEILHGLDALGAGLQADDIAVDQRRLDFTLVRLQFNRQTRLDDLWSVRFDALAQHSAHMLPDSQRFKIGGDRLGRGFEVAEIAGDSGAGAKVELRRQFTNDVPVAGKISAYGFYDIGAAWKQDSPGRESAATAGVGMSMNGANLSGNFEVAAPLTGADVEGSDEASLFAELSYRF